MKKRSDLTKIFEKIIGSGNVHFQPPPLMSMKHPCIVYEWSNNHTTFADDKPYTIVRKYTVTVIDRDPDSPISGEIAKLPMTLLNRRFTTVNLHHSVFTIHY